MKQILKYVYLVITNITYDKYKSETKECQRLEVRANIVAMQPEDRCDIANSSVWCIRIVLTKRFMRIL